MAFVIERIAILVRLQGHSCRPMSSQNGNDVRIFTAFSLTFRTAQSTLEIGSVLTDNFRRAKSLRNKILPLSCCGP